MARIIPGVQVTVVKEVAPPQLAPSGVLGLVGITEKNIKITSRASSWSSFLEICGQGSAYSMPDARMALANGVYELVIVPVDTDTATSASVELPTSVAAEKIKFEARVAGNWANDYLLKVTHRIADTEQFDLEIRLPGLPDNAPPLEMHRNLEPKTLVTVLDSNSAIIKVATPFVANKRPDEGIKTLTGGLDLSKKAYIDALEALKDESDVDMVYVAIQDYSDAATVTEIYSNVISHCQLMSADSKGRMGIGHIPLHMDLVNATKMSNTLLSDRFVLLSPFGVAGAVAGCIGALDYFQSPTFKTIAGVVPLSRSIPLEEQSGLLKSNIVPVVEQRGRGVIILRGLTTDGDQISVRRVADRAVRGTRLIGELFIGRLNNEDGRGALKQKLIEFLSQMQKEGGLVPSTDGKSPAFNVNVYSSQDDFVKGIVRVDIAVRPVRAIDFIYATILVQV
jgi:hypothetical protein